MKGTPAMPQCGFSRATVQVLDLHGVPPEKMKTYDVLEDPELRSGIKEFSEWPTIPQLYVGGEFVGGCDIVLGSTCTTLSLLCFLVQYLYTVHQSGELASLLEKNDIIPPAVTSESSSSQTSN